MNLPATLANAIIVLVSLVWAGNFLASAFLPGYQPDPTLNFVFMTIVGGALALRSDGVSGIVQKITGRHAVPPKDPPR